MLENEIKSFIQNMNTVRAYIDSVEPVLIEKISENLERDQDDLSALLLLFSDPSFNDDDFGLDLTEQAKEKIRENFGGDIIVEHSDDSDGCEIRVIGPGGIRFAKAMEKFTQLENQKKLLYKSSLMSIVSTVECFLLDLLQAYFSKYHNELTSSLISKKDKHFTLDELEAFGDINDAKTYIIDSKLENLLRGSFEEWIEFLKDKLNLDILFS